MRLASRRPASGRRDGPRSTWGGPPRRESGRAAVRLRAGLASAVGPVVPSRARGIGLAFRRARLPAHAECAEFRTPLRRELVSPAMDVVRELPQSVRHPVDPFELLIADD